MGGILAFDLIRDGLMFERLDAIAVSGRVE